MSFTTRLEVLTATIATGETASSVIDTAGGSLVAIVAPVGYLGNEMYFQGSVDNQNYYDIYNIQNTRLAPLVKANRMTLAFPADFAACTYLKLVSDTAQSQNITLTLITRCIN